jgi:photosynthetic reaction center cytochrome c subunit
MNRVWIAAVAASVACSGARRSESPSPPRATPSPQAPTQASSPAPPKDSVTLERERYVAEVRATIAGKEQLPAGEVFKNVKMNPQMPAARLLAVMNIGYGRSLGVSCTHCHVPGQWDSETKTQKQTARDMSAMVARINNELLKPIPNLKGPNAIVNCTTCHRGQVKPALDMQ